MVPQESIEGRGHAALYIGSLAVGGAERVMVNLAGALFARGWRVTFVTTYLADEEYEVPHALWRRADDGTDVPEDGNGDAREPARTAGRVVHALTLDEQRVDVRLLEGKGIARVFSGVASEEAGGRLTAFRARREKLEAIWDNLQPDVILSFIGKNNLMALLTARKRRIPVVVSVRATPGVEYPTRGMRLAAAALFPRAAAVAVQSEAAAAWFPGRVQRRAVVVPNAVAREFLTDENCAATASAEAVLREKTIVAVGRLDADKNAGILIHAFARLLRERGVRVGDGAEVAASGTTDAADAYRLLLYGDGALRGALEEETAALGIAGRVRFLGRQNGIAEKIRNAGIFALTSDREGMPNTLIEAMCLGLPCVTTDCVYGGVGQIAEDGVNALVVPPGDEGALAAALGRLIDDPVLAARLGENARKLRERYDPESVVDAWEGVLIQATGRQSGAVLRG